MPGSTFASIHRRSLERPAEFWGEAAADIDWTRTWDKVLDRDATPAARWFVGGELNTCYNALDRHADGQRGEQPALIGGADRRRLHHSGCGVGVPGRGQLRSDLSVRGERRRDRVAGRAGGRGLSHTHGREREYAHMAEPVDQFPRTLDAAIHGIATTLDRSPA